MSVPLGSQQVEPVMRGMYLLVSSPGDKKTGKLSLTLSGDLGMAGLYHAVERISERNSQEPDHDESRTLHLNVNK